jgi:hypothetical protein
VVTSVDDSDAVPHTSLAVGVANAGDAGQNIVEGAGSALIVGAVLSITVICCDADAVLPHASVAVHLLVIV